MTDNDIEFIDFPADDADELAHELAEYETMRAQLRHRIEQHRQEGWTDQQIATAGFTSIETIRDLAPVMVRLH